MATNARGQRVLTQKMWGLKALRRLHINARRETVHTATSVKHAFAHGRAVELANGFYEPKGAKGPQNRPWYYFAHTPHPDSTTHDSSQPWQTRASSWQKSSSVVTNSKPISSLHVVRTA